MIDLYRNGEINEQHIPFLIRKNFANYELTKQCRQLTVQLTDFFDKENSTIDRFTRLEQSNDARFLS